MGKVIQVIFNGIGLAAGSILFIGAMIYLCIFDNKGIKDWLGGSWD